MIRRLGMLVLLALAPSCARVVTVPEEPVPPAEPLVWPVPPETPRIKYLYGFRDARDLGFRKPFFENLWETIAGVEEPTMVRPYAVAVDEEGRVAVADPGAGVVHLFDVTEKRYDRITQAGETLLLSPVGVAFGGDHLYVSDSISGEILIFDRAGRSVEVVDGFERPTGLAYDTKSGRLYVAETVGHRIAVLDATGHEVFSIGRRGRGPGEFNFPTHLVVRHETLYVNDTMNFRLQAFDLDGTFLGAFGTHGDGSGNFAQPKGVGVDAEGNVYVADSLFNRVQIFDRDGRFLLAFGEPGAGEGKFWLPAGLAIEGNHIYVADSYNRRVQVFEFLGGG